MKFLTSFSALLWLVALALTAYTFSKLPFENIGTSIAALTWLQWSGWVFLNLLIILTGNLRWFLLNEAMGFRVRFLRLLAIRQAGQTLSFITPGPQFGGEPLQIFWLCAHEKVAPNKAVAALGLDRICELLVNFSVLLAGVILLAISSSAGAVEWTRIIFYLLLLIIALLTGGWVLLCQPRWAGKIFGRALTSRRQHARVQKFSAQWQALCNNLRNVPMRGRNGLATALLLSILGWIGIVCELWMLLRFLDLAVTLQALVLILVAIRFAMLLPIPGGIGTIEAAVLWCFSTLTFPPLAALGLIALMRVRDFTVLFAGLCAWLTVRSSRPIKTVFDTPPSK